MVTPPLPGAIGTSRLRVYPWATDDGLHGGSPHIHLTCTECYLVLGGRGELHTLTPDGFEVYALEAGRAVWFTPGTVHRAVNIDRLEVQVLMQNDGLPEAGDAVLTFPPEYLTDPARYAEVAVLGEGDQADRADRARRRRDLAVTGFGPLRDAVVAGDAGPLHEFYQAATSLVHDRLDTWEKAWAESAAAVTARTGHQIDALRRGDTAHLDEASSATIAPETQDVLGMCGYLAPYT